MPYVVKAVEVLQQVCNLYYLYHTTYDSLPKPHKTSCSLSELEFREGYLGRTPAPPQVATATLPR